MKKSTATFKTLLLLSLVILFSMYSNWARAQYTYTSLANTAGNWSSTAEWTSSNGGTHYPGFEANDVAIIASGAHNVTLDITPAFPITSLNIGSAATLGQLAFGSVGGPFTLTVTGTVTLGTSSNVADKFSMASGGTLICGALAVGGMGTTWAPGTGTVELTATNTLPSTIFTTFNNLTINSGTTTLGVAIPTISGTLTINDGGILALGTFPIGASIPPSLTMQTGGATGSSITGTGAGILLVGTTVTINAVAGTHGASVSAPVALDGSNTTFNVAAGGGISDLSISGVISGTGFGLTKSGAGIMNLSGANTYTGTTAVSGGTLQYNTINSTSAASALGAANSAITINGSGVLDFVGSLAATSNRAITLTGPGTVSADGTIVSATLTLSGNVTGSTQNLTLSGAGVGVLSGNITTTTGTVTQAGSGTWTLSGASTYSGTTSVTGGGTLKYTTITSTGVSVGNSSLGLPLTLANGTIALKGTLDYIGTTSTSNRVINLTAASTVSSEGTSLTLSGGITGNTENLTLSGTGTGIESGAITTTTGTVAKSGSGKWTLSGSNTYSGGTTLNTGELDFGGAGTSQIGTGTFTINGGSLDNTTGAGFTYGNTISQTWNGGFTFVGSLGANSALNMGTGAITFGTNANPTIAINGGSTLTEGGNINTSSNLQNLTTTATTATGTLALAAGTDFLNVLTIGANSAITLTSGSLNLSGSTGLCFVNNGTFSNGLSTSTVAFNGSVAQSTSGNAPTFYKLTLNNSNGLTLGSAATVSNTLTLTNGLLNTTSANLLSVTATATGAVFAGNPFSATNCVNGPLKRSLAASTSYTYPLGDGLGDYYPAMVAVSSTASSPIMIIAPNNGNVGASSFNDPFTGGMSITEYWNAALSGTFTGTISLLRSTSNPIDAGTVIGQSTLPAGAYSLLGASASGYTYSIVNSLPTLTTPSTAFTGTSFTAGAFPALGYLVLGNSGANGRFGIWFDYY